MVWGLDLGVCAADAANICPFNGAANQMEVWRQPVYSWRSRLQQSANTGSLLTCGAQGSGAAPGSVLHGSQAAVGDRIANLQLLPPFAP